MIAVTPARAYRSTLFQTVSTLPQVVSTRMQPRSRRRARSSCGHAEGGDDDDVVRADRGQVIGSGPAGGQEADPHLGQLAVHARVVDDLARQPDPAVGEAVARLVGVLDRAIDAVAEAELAGQAQAWCRRGRSGSRWP